MGDHNRTPEAQEVFKEKKRPKNPVKLSIQLNEEQKRVKECVYENDITFILGNYGSGKTLCACAIALDLLHKGDVEQIIVARPFDFKATGYLTGSAEEKLQYHMMPIKQNFYRCYAPSKVDEYYKENKIQILPIPYLRGVTFTNAAVIIDELQEVEYQDFELILSRLGKDSKIMFTGSQEQNVLGNKSCINKIMKLKDSGLVCFTELQSNHRNPKIEQVLEYLKNA
jgi:phosphate starvation-inducible protein PhoH